MNLPFVFKDINVRLDEGELDYCEFRIEHKIKLACPHCSLEGVPDSFLAGEILVCENCARPLINISVGREIPSFPDDDMTSVEELPAPVPDRSGKDTAKGYTLAVGSSTIAMKTRLPEMKPCLRNPSAVFSKKRSVSLKSWGKLPPPRVGDGNSLQGL